MKILANWQILTEMHNIWAKWIYQYFSILAKFTKTVSKFTKRRNHAGKIFGKKTCEGC